MSGDRRLYVVRYAGCDACMGEGCDACDDSGVAVEYIAPTPADLAAHLRTLPHAEQVAALVALLRECPDAAVEALCCPACGQVLALRVQRAEHDGFGHITAPRNVWLECPDGCAGVPRVG